jgi:polyhydroxyalkanoate synthesis regulator phasin
MMTKSELRQMTKLIQEAIDEGLMDKLRSAVGLKSNDLDEYKIIPKDQWEALIKDNDRAVNMLANTPGARDAAGLMSELLDQLVQSGSMEARKAQRAIRDAIKGKNKEELLSIVRGLQREADKIRSVRSHVRLKRESPESIAKMIGEDIKVNNGLLIE